MSQTEHTILGSWPGLKRDLESFLSDTDSWAISELRKAYEDKNWETVRKTIEVMELLHDMSHAH